MNVKRGLSLLLAALVLLAALPLNGVAATKPTIRLGGKVGFMFVGGAVTLKPKLTGVKRSDVRFSSSEPLVASVDGNGRIQALAEGRTVITVSAGSAKARCGVVVLPRSVSVKAGSAFSLPNGTVEKYAVRDKAIAAVSKKGVITGKKTGDTQVKVKYGNQVLVLDVHVTAGDASDTWTDAWNEPVVPEPTGDVGTKTSTDPKVEGLAAAASASQIVLVEYEGGSKATLTVHEKKDGAWKQVFETPAYVGKNGIGKTKEGDKKTPKGTYNLNTPFGILADPGANMPYTKVTKYHYWCGSSKSGYYNQLCDSRVNGRSYTSSDEHLIDYKGAYNYCMFIDYNAAGVAGKGSCIFLHCFSKNKYTAGCVAVSEASMKKIIKWAKPGVKIVIQ